VPPQFSQGTSRVSTPLSAVTPLQPSAAANPSGASGETRNDGPKETASPLRLAVSTSGPGQRTRLQRAPPSYEDCRVPPTPVSALLGEPPLFSRFPPAFVTLKDSFDHLNDVRGRAKIPRCERRPESHRAKQPIREISSPTASYPAPEALSAGSRSDARGV
jgi:hypothetical protein